ncbi:MAG: ATP-binding protein [Granulosicoccus sp.]
MKLKYQLFLALLAGGGVLIVLLAVIADWSFNRSFLDYVNDNERQRLESLNSALVDGYARQGDWLWIAGRNRDWRVLVNDTLRPRGRPERALADRPDRPPPKRIKPASNEPLDRAPPARPERLPPDRPPPRPSDSPGGLSSRSLLLADAQRNVLIGGDKPQRGVNWAPLELQGQVIGYLGNMPLRRAPPGLDRVFAERQRRNFILASLALLPVSALMAWILTTRIVRPLDTLKTAISRIGDGEFTNRLPADRRDELGDLSRQVNRLASALESNLHARQRWLAEISHELRTPVAVLQAELEAMQDGIMPVDQKALTSLHQETQRLGRLIDDLRDLTLSDAGALAYQFDSLDLAKLISELLEPARTLVSEAELELTLNHDGSALLIEADAQRIAQLINNLLQNSLRYTDAGGSLQVTLDRKEHHARLYWADSAPGVSSTDLQHLFDPLYRVDASRQRASGGSGLGLAIVGKIAEAHGGHVKAESSSLGGLAIELLLPLAVDATNGSAGS